MRVSIGPLTIGADVVYWSPTGAHGFGAIRVLDDSEKPVAIADPTLLAAACSADARSRALPTDPINATDAGTLVDWAMLAPLRGARDPLELSPEQLRTAKSITDARRAREWLTEHVHGELVPRALGSPADQRDTTVTALTGGVLGVIGVLGRRGIVHEAELLGLLHAELARAVAESPDRAELIRSWLERATLPSLAVLNGSQLRYGGVQQGGRPYPVPLEVPNPLPAHGEVPAVSDSGSAAVPGVVLPELSEFSLRAVQVSQGEGGPDVSTVHRWMNTEHVAVNWKQDWPYEQWRAELATQLSGMHSVPCLVGRHGQEFAYVELYRVARDKLAPCYPYEDHDVGVHIALGEPASTGRGVGSSLLNAVAEGVLAADPRCRRVVAEPDVRNVASVSAFGKAGFSYTREVGLPTKNSALMVFERS